MSSHEAIISRQHACGFRLSMHLGSGATANVYLGVQETRAGPVAAAVKLVDKTKLPAESRDILAQEATALKQLSHPCIVPLLAVDENETHAAFATKYCADGDLLDVLNQKRGIPERQAAQIFVKLCDAVLHAHASGWAHRDLKPENILLHDSQPFIADWGSAVQAHIGQHCIGFAGTDGYAAPEIRDAPSYCPFTADVWSFGATLFVACAATFPFANDRVRHCSGPLFLPAHFSPELQELLRGCLAPASRRWSMAQVRACKWFSHENNNSSRQLARSLMCQRAAPATCNFPRSPRAHLPPPLEQEI